MLATFYNGRAGDGGGAEKKGEKGGWIRKNQRGDFFFFNTMGKMK